LERSRVGDVVNEDPDRRIADVVRDNGSVKLLPAGVSNAQTYNFMTAVHNDNVAIADDRWLSVQKRGLPRTRIAEKTNF
jgi:hypothetical protein